MFNWDFIFAQEIRIGNKVQLVTKVKRWRHSQLRHQIWLFAIKCDPQV